MGSCATTLTLTCVMCGFLRIFHMSEISVRGPRGRDPRPAPSLQRKPTLFWRRLIGHSCRSPGPSQGLPLRGGSSVGVRLLTGFGSPRSTEACNHGDWCSKGYCQRLVASRLRFVRSRFTEASHQARLRKHCQNFIVFHCKWYLVNVSRNCTHPCHVPSTRFSQPRSRYRRI